jgi:1-phosphofructokinase family hexose kinase
VILSVTLNPCVDHALFVENLKISDTNRVTRTETDAGGKGVNLSRVVAELGSPTVATGFLGGGPGAFIRKVLKSQGVKHDFVDIDEDTRMNFSVEDTSGVPPTTLNEKGPLITSDEWKSLLDHFSKYARKATWVTLGGSLPPGVPIDAYAILTHLAKDCGAKVLLDADGETLKQGLVAVPQMIKPNAKEASRLLGTPIDTLDQALVAVKSLLGLGTEIAILSRGADGAVLATKQGVWSGVSPTVETHSTIGSGDSLLGGFLWALEAGKPIEEAFRYGLAAGAATATTDGSEIARKAVIERLLPNAIVNKV